VKDQEARGRLVQMLRADLRELSKQWRELSDELTALRVMKADHDALLETPQELPFAIDDERSILIYGIRYSMAIFQMIGVGPVGSLIRLAGREGDTVTFETIQDFRPSRDRAIELLRERPIFGDSDWEREVAQFLKDVDAGPAL
jgi:hypothetical protein